ncbi:fructose-bisphosphate aldolase isoform X4 [Bombyx mori]|uniref:Fructose-bisphosphate aldolase n=1 Tax=Bombyx mori TaxID=7091 RepID=A0A8R2C7C8_BOMMO|nr:fructose-bisphosphate aldolase isoform X2 [Bombyx mori]
MTVLTNDTTPSIELFVMTTYFSRLDVQLQEELKKTAEAILASGKGILAVDETNEGIGKLLKNVGLENTENNRRRYRELLFTTPDLAEHISAVILYDETVYQKTDDGTPFIELLNKLNIIPGIKVDKDVTALFLSEDEMTTQGLDDLGKRCAAYKKQGCRFAKWRCPVKIGLNTPSVRAINDTATILARYASICQSEGLVPIVEPDVLLDGDHDIERAQKVTEVVLAAVYKALNDHHVFLEGTLLKPNMVTPGQGCTKKSTPKEIAIATRTALLRGVPAAVPGIAFLSGGQTEEEATLNLNEINKVQGKKPWILTFSYGRALQASVWQTWAGKDENLVKAQKELLKRTKANGLASLGNYEAGTAISAAGDETNYSANYKY